MSDEKIIAQNIAERKVRMRDEMRDVERYWLIKWVSFTFIIVGVLLLASPYIRLIWGALLRLSATDIGVMSVIIGSIIGIAVYVWEKKNKTRE